MVSGTWWAFQTQLDSSSDERRCVEATALSFDGRRRPYGLQLSAKPRDEASAGRRPDVVEVENFETLLRAFPPCVRLWIASAGAG